MIEGGTYLIEGDASISATPPLSARMDNGLTSATSEFLETEASSSSPQIDPMYACPVIAEKYAPLDMEEMKRKRDVSARETSRLHRALLGSQSEVADVMRGVRIQAKRHEEQLEYLRSDRARLDRELLKRGIKPPSETDPVHHYASMRAGADYTYPSSFALRKLEGDIDRPTELAGPRVHDLSSREPSPRSEEPFVRAQHSSTHRPGAPFPLLEEAAPDVGPATASRATSHHVRDNTDATEVASLTKPGPEIVIHGRTGETVIGFQTGKIDSVLRSASERHTARLDPEVQRELAYAAYGADVFLVRPPKVTKPVMSERQKMYYAAYGVDGRPVEIRPREKKKAVEVDQQALRYAAYGVDGRRVG